MPTITPAQPGTSRLARSSGTATTSRSTPSARSTTSRSAASRNESGANNGRTTTSTLAPRSGTISERSTLQSLRGTDSSFRGSSSGPNEPITNSFGGGSGHHTTSYGTYGHSGYWGGYSCPPSFYWGHSYSFGFHFGFSPFSFHGAWLAWNAPGFYYYPYFWANYGFGYHFHSHAFLAGHAWHILPIYHGWFGFNWGGHCSYLPLHHWRHHHHFNHLGFHYRVCRPYWYGYARWYDYSPYSYSYTTLVYDSLYDDGYDDGYDRGYNRGYEDGGEDASAYKDDRRRDRIGEKYDRKPDSELDRAKADAAEEFRFEMDRGTEAFTQGDYKTATKAYKEAAILNPDSADARYSLAVSAFAEGKYSFAAFALRRGVALDAAAGNIDLQAAFKDPVVLKGYADNLNAELAENPEDGDLLLLSGYVALRTGNAADAAEKFDRALKAAPQDSSAQALQRQAMEALEKD